MREPHGAIKPRVSGGAEDGRSQGGADRSTSRGGAKDQRTEGEPVDPLAQVKLVTVRPEAFLCSMEP